MGKQKKNSKEQLKKHELKEKLKASVQPLLQTMFKSHQAILLLIEPCTGEIIDANEAAVQFYKYRREELQQLTIQDINALEANEVEKERLKALNEERHYFVFPHRLATGEIRWVEVYSSSFYVNEDRILLSIIHDITDRKKAEEALKRSEEKFSSAFRLNPHIMMLTSFDDGTIYDVNSAFYNLTGYHQNEIIGKTTKEIGLYVSIAERGKMLKILQKNEPVKNREIKIKSRSGEIFDVLISAEKLQTSFGNTIISSIRDITDRKKAAAERERLIQQLDREKKALMDSEKRYRIMGEAIDFGVWATDAEGKAIYISESFCQLIGRSCEEIIEHGWIDHLIPEQRQKVKNLWMHSVRTGEIFEHEHHFITGNGQIKIILARGKPIRDQEGKITSWAGINLDITERKKIQDQLQEQNDHLQKINEVLEDFVQIVAHDLRSPINNLLSMSELMEKQPSAESKEVLFKMIGPVTKKLQRTVDGLMEAISLQLNENLSGRTINLDDIWKEVKEELHSLIEDYKGTIKTDFQEAPQIHYIEVHLVSILRNLISNAIKYSAKSANPEVIVKTHREEEYLVLTVKDNGIGMDLEKAGSDLFKPFKRFTSAAEGTGMGLYIIKNIVEKNGGYVEVQSELQKGTTFYCYLKEYPD